MANKWLAHIKKTMKQMKSKGTYKKGMGLKQVIMAAKKTWHKAKRGGGDSDEEEKKLVDVDLAPESTGTTGAEVAKGQASEDVGGGKRRRKTRRRRHTRRR